MIPFFGWHNLILASVSWAKLSNFIIVHGYLKELFKADSVGVMN
jgi:hypothetical protein